MAGGKIVGITIDIEGKSDGLVKSLKEANSSISATSAALKDVDKALQLDPTNVELLAQKEELLNKQIEQTNQKLEIMQQVANDANQALENGDITQEQYASLTAEISRTNSELGSLTQQAEDNSQAMQDIEDGVDGAADQMEELDDASEETGHSLDALGGIAIAVGATMATAFVSAVAAVEEAGKALIGCTLDASSLADELLTMSSVTGLSTQTLQELNYAAELLDVDTSTITSSMTKMEKSMASAAAAGEDVETAYDKIGVSIQNADGSFRSAEDVFWDTIDALGQIEDPVERDLMAMELMGKSAKDLNPLIEAGSEAFRELADEANETGYVMSDEVLDAYGAFDDQMQRLNNGATAAKNALGTVLLPTLTNLSGAGTSALNKFTKAMNEADGDITKIGPAVSDILKELVGEVTKEIPGILELITSLLQTLVEIIIENLPMLLDAAMQIITTLTETLLAPENLAKIIDAAVNIILTLVTYLLNNIDMILNAAIQIVLTVVQGITKALPQLIPAVVDAVLTIAETLLAPENLSMILDAGLQLIIALAGALIDSLPEIIDRLPEIITGIVDFLLSEDGLGKIASTGFDLLVGIVQKLPEIIVEIVTAVGDIIAGPDGIINKIGSFAEDVWNAFKDIFPTVDDVIEWGKDLITGIGDGIREGWSSFTGAIGDAADYIADHLSFSVPEKGVLHEWAYNNPGEDMMKLYAEGIEDGMPELQNSIDATANLLAGTPDDVAAMQSTNTQMAAAAFAGNQNYSEQLNGILGAIGGLGGETQIIIPVYIGQDRIETMVAQANTNLAYISGGR